ncbi:MAG: ribonuclease III [Sedimentisphaerales bacterium]|nr:ribonuclease III [Sedimentisphaerales bacterium]
MNQEDLQKLERIIGYHFSDPNLLEKALCHSSYVENRGLSNERLEFLGDAIFGMIICLELYNEFPDYLEGNLTKIKSTLVSRRSCAQIVKKLDIQDFLKIGKGMAGSKALSGSLAAALFEALVAAIYLDGGLKAAKEFIVKNFISMIKKADAEQTNGNYKSVLQQHSQQSSGITPVYNILDEKGPDHNKCFEVEAVIAGRHFSSAWGTNKKDAEQMAAKQALIELGFLKNKSK